MEDFPGPPLPPEPTHPPGSLSPTLYEQWDHCCRGDLGERGGSLSGMMLYGTRSLLRKVRLLLLAWLHLSQRCCFPAQHRWEAKKPLGRQVGQETLGSAPRMRADLQMELLLAWLCALCCAGSPHKVGSGCVGNLSRILFPAICAWSPPK